MKILFVSDAWEPQVNGVVRTLKMTRRELALKGHQTELVSPLDFRSVPCPTYPEISLALASMRAMERLIDRHAPDCLHIVTEGPLGWLARRIALRRKWPFTTAFHSRFPEYVYARFRIPVNWTYALLRRFHNAAHFTLAPTPAIVADLKARGFHGARLWTRGVDFGMFDHRGPRLETDKRPVFLYVGRIAIEKQVDAFLRLNLPGEKWVAGEGPARRQLEARYPDARWINVLDGPDLARLYRSADVMVFPSVTDTFGLVMLESMACGTPVAAFPVAGPIDVIGNSSGGIMHVDLREACLQALELPRHKARERAEQFSWANATDQMLAALQVIPGSATSPATHRSGVAEVIASRE